MLIDIARIADARLENYVSNEIWFAATELRHKALGSWPRQALPANIIYEDVELLKGNIARMHPVIRKDVKEVLLVL